ncbi:MAG: response regulator [Mariprofundaceae bacterium]|nr:response regulator [Mariprofundaceae bacterium]
MSKILVTDDSAFLRKRTCSILSPTEHDIIQAKDGQECIDKLIKNKPDVLFLDLVMPKVNGFEVLEYMQEHAVNVPTVVLTADIQEGVSERCMRLGAIAYLNKPPKPDEVLAALNLALVDAT